MKLKEFPEITFIFRNFSYEEVSVVAKLLSESKKKYAIEIPLANHKAIGVIEELKTNYPELIIGAGTVINLEQLREVHEKGVEFVLSPIKMTKEMLDYCQKHNIISVPGAFTPSEINEMKELNADIIKVFPMNSLNETFLKDVQAPFGKLPIMAVGGVNKNNASSLLNTGASYLGIGSGVFEKEDLQSQNFNKLKKSLIEFEKKVEI